MQRVIVPGIHSAVAGIVAIVAVIGLFGTGPSPEAGDAVGGVFVVGGPGIAFFIVLPLAGIVGLGVWDWNVGRGPSILRAADVAVFALAWLELAMGTIGIGRWILGAMALAAASGLAATVILPAPRRAGFRR